MMTDELLLERAKLARKVYDDPFNATETFGPGTFNGVGYELGVQLAYLTGEILDSQEGYIVLCEENGKAESLLEELAKLYPDTEHPVWKFVVVETGANDHVDGAEWIRRSKT